MFRRRGWGTMQDIDIGAVRLTAVWATFAIGFVLGAVMNRSHFCTMGAISDVLNLGSWTRMRMWLAAIGTAMAAVAVMATAGLIDPAKALYATPNFTWLSYVVGGFLFGFGMVLSSGCGSKTLVRMGAGSLKAVVTFIVLGLFAYMTLKGVFGVLRVNYLDPFALRLEPGQDLPRLLADGDAQRLSAWRLWLGLGLGGALLLFALMDREFRRFDALAGSVVVGLCVAGVWYVSGHVAYVAEDPNTLEEAFVGTNSGRLEALSFVAPVAYIIELLMFWSDTTKLVTIGIAAALGVIAGSFAYAVATRSFRWEGFRDAEDTANHLVGGALMGVGGVTALGCTVGQGLSGLSVLTLGSFAAFAAIIVGGVAAIRYQVWRIERIV